MHNHNLCLIECHLMHYHKQSNGMPPDTSAQTIYNGMTSDVASQTISNGMPPDALSQTI